MKKNSILFSFLFLCNIILLQAQEEFPHIKGDLLIQLQDGYNIEQAVTALAYHKGLQTQSQSKRLISKNLNIWLVHFNPAVVSHSAMLSKANQREEIVQAQLNYIIEKRLVPSDASYGQQWQYEQTSDFDLDAEAAWDITTGGVTALGDTIVVCVIDDGIEVSHPDWGDNIWYNRNEIAGNGIDDDGNGYIDDYRGWNADANTNDILPPNPWNTHGTPVAGIVGAQGNNGIGVSGVNWNVKVMFVVGGGSNSDALAAYDYPLSCRKLYNQSNGTKGAFVVATNASWGINNQDCATYAPLVNAMYDSLGTAGVLNAAATANANTNVDIQGDFPTSCNSDYLVAVTNMQQNGTKVTQAGYGTTHIDLGAYGEGTYTIASSASYGGFGGTSGATPHVAGAIGLLYSAPCPRLALLARTQPAQTALLMKQMLLNSTVANSTLQANTVTGGVLNLKNALDSVMNIGCSLSGCHEPYLVSANAISGSSALFSWDRIDSTSLYYYRYRLIGSSVWSSNTAIDTFATIAGLTACSNYEFQVAANCDSSNYSSIYQFKTTDCCEAPNTVSNNYLGLTSASFSWPTVSNANTYTVEYKLKTASSWTVVNTATDSILLTGLDSCSVYELRILSSCNTNVNNQYSNTIEFETSGCGSCTKTSYCTAAGGNSGDDWIEAVVFAGINNTSGNNNGFASFVSTGPGATVLRGLSYPITVNLGYNTGPWANNWRVKAWIDYDQDETFDANTELVFDTTVTSLANLLTGNVTIPATAQLSKTRMRVSVKWTSNNVTPCESMNYGEIEDYCVDITAGTNNSLLSTVNNSLNIYPNPFEQQLLLDLNNDSWATATVSLRNITGQLIQSHKYELQIGSNLLELQANELPKGVYLLSLQGDNGEILTQKIIKK